MTSGRQFERFGANSLIACVPALESSTRRWTGCVVSGRVCLLAQGWRLAAAQWQWWIGAGLAGHLTRAGG